MAKSLEPYVFIPKSTMLNPIFKAIKPHARLLYTYMILKRAGKDEWFSYSYKEIRMDAGYRFEMIAKCIRQLADAGFMKYEHGGLEVNSNMYYLDPAWLKRKESTS